LSNTKTLPPLLFIISADEIKGTMNIINNEIKTIL